MVLNSHDHQSLLVVLLINIGKASRSCILISVVTRTSTNCPDIKPYHQEYLSSKMSWINFFPSIFPRSMYMYSAYCSVYITICCQYWTPKTLQLSTDHNIFYTYFNNNGFEWLKKDICLIVLYHRYSLLKIDNRYKAREHRSLIRWDDLWRKLSEFFPKLEEFNKFQQFKTESTCNWFS